MFCSSESCSSIHQPTVRYDLQHEKERKKEGREGWEVSISSKSERSAEIERNEIARLINDDTEL